jgi:nitrous oxidase accessory protein
MQLSRKRLKTTGLTAVLVLALTLSVATLAPLNFLSVSLAKADAKTIVVPTDFATITAAVGNASAGDTVFVKSGTYRENPEITKPLTLTGENSATTIVIGEGGASNSSVFMLSSGNVKISGFTIKSQDYNNSAVYASGIIVGGNGCTITGNVITNVNKGIYVGGWGDLCGGKCNTTISQNNITGAYGDGIRMFGGYGNNVTHNLIVGSNTSAISVAGYSNYIVGNTLTGNRRGIGMGSANSVVFGNNVTGTLDWAVYLQVSNDIVAANNFQNNRIGAYLSPSFAPGSNEFVHNNFINCTTQVKTGSVFNVQVWDNGTQGNFWSNYNGTDADGNGVGDSPMFLDVNNSDVYPLMVAFNLATAGAPPAPVAPSTVGADHVAAFWHFDNVDPSSATPDATGFNPVVLGSAKGNITCPPQPVYVEGKVDRALLFDIPEYIYGSASPSLDITGDITLDVWVNVTALENTTYNNFMVYGARTLDKYQSRVYGFGVNGQDPENATSGPPGAIQAYVYTDSGYNEIVTQQPAIQLNTWEHVVFVRSQTTGMHIYVNGIEQAVKAVYGVQNPTGPIKRGTELNIGHDYIGVIDELKVSNVAIEPQPETTATPAATETPTTTPTAEPVQGTDTPIWQQWWLWTTVIAIGVIAGSGFFLLRRNTTKKLKA